MFAWLYKLLHVVPPEERRGIRLAESWCWKVQVRGLAFSDFIHVLPELLEQGSVLYLEGGEHPKQLKAFLEANKIDPHTKVQMGTVWPRPTTYHLPTDAAFLRELARITDKCANPEVCDHLSVYKDGVVLVQAYVCLWDPLYISRRIPLQTLKTFCEKLERSYEETREMA